jgi:hypothetical protein
MQLNWKINNIESLTIQKIKLTQTRFAFDFIFQVSQMLEKKLKVQIFWDKIKKECSEFFTALG